MSKLNFEVWYEKLKKEAPKYGFADDLMAKIDKSHWKVYFYRGVSPSGALCEYSFEATGIV